MTKAKPKPTKPAAKAPMRAAVRKPAPKRAPAKRDPASSVGKQPTRDRRTSQPAYAAAAALRTQILELRTLGRTIVQIAEAVNRAPSVVHGHLKTALTELDEDQREQVAQYRALSYNRLERMLAKAMLKAAGGDLKAMREAQRLIMSQARIMGFEAPIKHSNTDPTGEHERMAPGTWQLPTVPGVTIEQWQAAAQRVLTKQRRIAEAMSDADD